MTEAKKYLVNGRLGKYRYTTCDGNFYCFWMEDTCEYEYYPSDLPETIVETDVPETNFKDGWQVPSLQRVREIANSEPAAI